MQYEERTPYEAKEKIKNILAENLYNLLKQDKAVRECDDRQCDNEDCVVFRALEQYMKYEFNPQDSYPLTFEFNINEIKVK